jgi:hypothetical protein
VPPPEHGRVGGRVVDRDRELVPQRLAVPDRAVGDDADRPANLGAQRQQVADGAGRGVAARLDDQDLARPDLLDRPLLGVQPGLADGGAVLGEQVLAERHVAQRPGEPGHLLARPGGLQPVEGHVVEAALAELGGERRRRYLRDRGQQVAGRIGRARGAAAAVGGLALDVVGVRHRARRAELVVSRGDRGAQPPGRQNDPQPSRPCLGAPVSPRATAVTSTSTRSPGWTTVDPVGVPVRITSPGSSVVSRDTSATISANENSRSSPLTASCASSPLTHVRSVMRSGSMARASSRAGPSGVNPSMPLDRTLEPRSA